MTAYILRRLLATIPVMAVVAMFVFFLLRLAPGDPAAIIAGEDATAEAIAHVRAQLGVARSNEVSDRSITGQRILRIHCLQKSRSICRVHSEDLPARSDRNLQSIAEHEDLILAKYRQRPLPVGRIIERTERRERRLKDRFVFVFKAGSRQVVTTETKIAARIKRVGAAVIYGHKGKVAERIESRKSRIDGRSIVIPPARSHRSTAQLPRPPGSEP